MGNTIQSLGQKEESSTFTCEICMEPISQNQRFKSKKCSHPLCKYCISKYIKIKVRDNIAKIECPDLECKKLIDPLYCRSILSRETFVKWCDILCESEILGLKRAFCPNRNCSALVVNECGATVRSAKCPSCKQWFCFQCKVPWHSGYLCRENGIPKDKNDVLLGKLVEKKGWQRCPSCNHIVDLVFGCLKIRCRCGCSFCYKCGMKLSKLPFFPDIHAIYCEGDKCFIILLFVEIFVCVILSYWTFRTLLPRS
ncbi:E3 ubiquitin-protein ligase RSL1-like [Tasmannia lanceolata]|uniref:E3 ubiquitin-protein ligase RSL1-like n=1 Tax=Tasmannia lanceolata TaxID=3420 RepID=UPI00406411F7